MPIGDWFSGGGLFGGYSGYDALSPEARDRANRRGLMTSGAMILGNSVGPLNQGFMRNISSALLAGRESFEDTLNREAQLAELAERKKKLEELEAEKIRMKEEEENRRFLEWQEKERRNTQMVDTISQATGKPFEAVDVLSDAKKADLYALHSGIIQPEVEEPFPDADSFGRWVVDPKTKGRTLIERWPERPKEIDPDAAEEKRDAAKEKWIVDREKMLARLANTEEFTDPATGMKKVLRTPKYSDPDEIRQLAESLWDREMGPFATGKVVSGGSSTTGGTGVGIGKPSAPAPRKTGNPISPPKPSDFILSREAEKASMLVERLGIARARAAMISAGGTEEEVDRLLELVTRSGGLYGNPG